jgi:hypothetical protein
MKPNPWENLMVRKLGLAIALICTAASLSACVVVPPGRPAGCYWVPAHYGPEGGYHPGHCR